MDTNLDTRDIILYLDIYYNHNWNKIYTTIKDKVFPEIFETPSSRIMLDLKLYSLIRRGYKILVIVDEEYPKAFLKNVIYPPFVIYYKCDIEDIPNKFEEIYYHPEEGCFLK